MFNWYAFWVMTILTDRQNFVLSRHQAIQWLCFFFHQSMTYHTVERYVRCRPTHLVILSISNIVLNSATWRLPLLMPAASPGSLSPTRQLLILCQRKALSCQRLRFRSLVRMWVGRGSKKTLYIDKYIYCISKNIIGWEGVNVVTAEPKKNQWHIQNM